MAAVFFLAVEQAEEVRQRAMESSQLSAAVATIREKGILSGKRIERTEVGPDDEFERAVVQRLSALGLRPMPEVKRDDSVRSIAVSGGDYG